MSLWSKIRNSIRGGRLDADIDDELRFHLEMDEAGGRDRRAARLRLGNVTRIREETRAMSLIEWLESILADARYGLRQLRHTPVLFAAVVLSLTIGIGASTAIFSLVDAAILKRLPVADPDRLLILEWVHEDFPPGATNLNGEFQPYDGKRRRGSSVPASLYRRMAAEQTGFDSLVGVAAYPDPIAIAVGTAPAEQVSIQYVSSNFFAGLGLPTPVGRGFLDHEDRPGQEPAVVVSHRYWMTRLAGDRSALDRPVRVNNVAARIVGVAPAGFFGTRVGQWPDVYAPLAAKVAFSTPIGGTPRAEDEGNWWVRMMGRLKPDVPEVAATTRAGALFKGMAVPAGRDVAPDKVPGLISLPGGHGFEGVSARDIRALWTLLLLVGVLLMIVCANVANLLLSRSVARHHESAMRLALGATRARIFRQHIIEGLMLALIGGAAGLGVGYALAQSIHLLFQTGRDASSAFDLHVGARTVLYTGALSLLTAFLFGLAPALRSARIGVGDAIKTQSRSVTGGGLRVPGLLVALQMALCLAALVAAGLLGKSLERLKTLDVGFDRSHVAYATVSPSRAGYSPERITAYSDRLRDRLTQVAGVVRVSPVQTRLMSGGGNAGPVYLPGRPPRLENGVLNREDMAALNAVGEGFFEALGISVVAGRAIDSRDLVPDASAVVVDELFARHFFPNQDPIGRRFGTTIDPKTSTRYEIVGVVGNSTYNSLRSDPFPTIYLPFKPGGTVHYAIRTSMDPIQLAEEVRRAVASIDPLVPLTEFHTQSGLIDRQLRTERMLGVISVSLGALALTIASIGLAGLLAYAVARRRTEIGVRIALGATTRDVVTMVLRDSFWLVGGGMIVGLPFAYAVGRALRTLLFQLEPVDVPTTATAFLVLCVVAVLAAWVPARRAASIDAISALRQD